MLDESNHIDTSVHALIPLAAPDLSGNERIYTADCIHSGWISSKGPYVRRFEAELAAWCGTCFGIVTSSGTAALHLALLALDIGPGDEVIVPAFTYVALANAIKYTGARPVFVDVDTATWLIDLNQIEDKITPQTRAIMAVHLYGHPVDMVSLNEIARRYGLWVIEDASEALGAKVNDQPVGSIGEIGCFSFYGNKVITTGEGGGLVTNIPALAEKARLLRNQAQVGPDYWHTQVGYNYRMTNLQAAVGLAQLERVAHFLVKRRSISAMYDHCFAGQPGLYLYEEPGWGESVCWLYSLLLAPTHKLQRDKLISFLACQGIESKPFFVPLPQLPAYRETVSYPVADHLARSGISLPTSIGMTPEQIYRVAQTVLQGLERYADLPG
jgi:perosamine synthetase